MEFSLCFYESFTLYLPLFSVCNLFIVWSLRHYMVPGGIDLGQIEVQRRIDRKVIFCYQLSILLTE